MKKLLSVLLAVLLVMSLTTAAFAAEPTTLAPTYDTTNGAVNKTGSIYFANPSDATYTIYKMLHLETYDATNNAYAYVVEPAWETFFKDTATEAFAKINKDGYVEWVTGADPVEFAKLALKWATDKNIKPTAISSEDPSFATDRTFSNLTLGYYLADTSIGVLCGLTTTKPTATVSAKNGVPTLDKTVQEDSNVGETNSFGDYNSAGIGETVLFDVTITAQNGAQNYVYHDYMSKGLEFIPSSLKVIYHDSTPATEDKRNVTLTDGVGYTLVTSGLGDTCTFEVRFSQQFLDDTVQTGDAIYIIYEARVTKDAVVGGEGNPNEAWLSYGDEHKTTHDVTTTYTYGFDIYKTDASERPLSGAEFKLYEDAACTKVMKFVYDNTTKTYRLPASGETANIEIIDVEDGNGPYNGVARIVGLDNGTYYLKETKAPTGYQLLTDVKTVIIAGNNLYVTEKTDGTGGVNIGSSVHVENNTGSTLPTTGGMGTTLFVTLGAVLVIGAGLLLVTKKRMSMVR